MLNKNRFSNLLVLVLLVQILIPNLANAQRYGRSSSSGRSGGGSSGMSFGQKAAVVGGIALGGYMVYRAYRNYEARTTQARQNNSYQRSGYYSSNDDESYDSSDSGYQGYSQSLTPAQKREIVKREYAEYKKRNLDTFAQSRAKLSDLMGQVQTQKNPAVICAAVCAGWTGFQLNAKPIAIGANSGDEGYQELTAQCKETGGILTDGVAANNQGSATISLNTPSNVCISNKFSSAQIEKIEGKNVPFTIHFHDITFSNDAKPVSQKFKMEALQDLNETFKMMSQFPTEQKMIAAAKQRKDVMDLAASLTLVSKDPVHGVSVYTNGKTNLNEKITLKLTVKREGLIQVEGTLPEATDHACGEEWHRVKILYDMDYTRSGEVSYVSPSLLSLTLSSASYQGEDNFCAPASAGAEEIPAF